MAASLSKITTSAQARENVTLANPTQIPGKTLQPGSYSTRLVDRLNDRMLVRADQKGSGPTTFLALPTVDQRGA